MSMKFSFEREMNEWCREHEKKFAKVVFIQLSVSPDGERLCVRSYL